MVGHGHKPAIHQPSKISCFDFSEQSVENCFLVIKPSLKPHRDLFGAPLQRSGLPLQQRLSTSSDLCKHDVASVRAVQQCRGAAEPCLQKLQQHLTTRIKHLGRMG